MGTNKGNLYNAKDICKGKFIDLLSPDCYPWWKFWDADDNGDTQWTYDNSVNVECFGKYDIMLASIALIIHCIDFIGVPESLVLFVCRFVL